MRILVSLCLLLWSLVAVAEVYKTHDKDGNVIYTDNPNTQGAEKVQLRELNTVPGGTGQAPVATSQPAPEEAFSYQLRIVSPRNEVGIPIGQRDLAVAVALQPELREEDVLVYYMDGELLEESKSTSIIVREIPRGTHVISVEAMDANGLSLGTSESVTVNLMRPPVKNNASPKPN